MEELIEIIIAIIAGAMKGRQKPPAVPFDEARQRALAAQMQALHQQVIGAQSRAVPVAARPQRTRPPKRGTPTPPPLPTRMAAVSTPAAAVAAQRPEAVRVTGTRVPLRVPVIMGEVLGPPLALREPEF